MSLKSSKHLAVLALLFLFATSAPAAETKSLPGHVPAAVAKFGLQPTGRLPATERLTLAIGLPLRNRPALTNLLQQLYNPASTNFHQYLSTEQFTEQDVYKRQPRV